MKIVLFFVVFVVAMLCFVTTREPPRLLLLKDQYKKFRAALVGTRYEYLLDKHPIITGTYTKGKLGSSVNKGYEINVCIDGDLNSMFHVLLHELAHCSVTEYSHSEQFWSNFKDLREIAERNGLYRAIPEYTPFCGKKIKD